VNDVTLIILYAVIAIAVVGTVAILLLKGRKTPPGTYTTTRDANDQAPAAGQGAGTDVLEAPPAPPARPVPLDEAPATDVEVADDLAGLETVAVETPAPVQGRLARLRARLVKSNNALGKGLLALLSRDNIDEDVWDEIEETLLLADVGAGPTGELLDALRSRVRVEGVKDPFAVRMILREQLVALVDPSLDRSLNTVPTLTDDGEHQLPAVVLVVGVNGTGKTTTVGKLARLLVAEGSSVVLGAADTFRAAAADQLTTWGSRVGVPTVRSDRDGADPAAVAFDAVRQGRATGADVVLVDTAGRLQNKAGLMDELGKIRRVITKEAPLSEVLLVLDATTGQNGLNQARVFAEVAGVTGIVLTKLDGTAKGGIVVAVQRELGVPVKLVGLGEGADDLAPFEPEDFVDGLLGDS
jgi:fused signal recognition particle receptor